MVSGISKRRRLRPLFPTRSWLAEAERMFRWNNGVREEGSTVAVMVFLCDCYARRMTAKAAGAAAAEKWKKGEFRTGGA